jgi:hypothetical protein
MGTLGIIRALLIHIQGESNPIYAAERRSASVRPGLDLARWRGCLFFLLLMAVPVLTWIETQGISLSAYRAALLDFLLIGSGGLLSIGWTVPLATLAGRGISRERVAQTWDALLVMPYPTDTILLAKAAANIQPAWRTAIGLAAVASLLGVLIAGPLMAVTALGVSHSAILAVLLMIAGMISIVAEREQEIALAVLVGLAAAFVSDSRRTVSLFGLAGGLMIRLVQTLLMLAFMIVLVPLASPNFALLNAVAGTATLLTAAPGLVGLAVLVGTLAVREGLIRFLFAWAVSRARRG